MRRRWGGAVLVAEREMRERVRSRSFRVITVILIVASLALVITPALFDDDGASTTRIGVAGGSPALPAALETAGAAVGLTVEVQGGTSEQVREGVDSGRLKRP